MRQDGTAVKILHHPIPHPILDFDRLSRPVPLSRDNEGTSVPLSWKVALSLPVWNNCTYKCASKMVLALLCHCSLGLAASCMFNSSVLCAPQLVFLTPKKGNVESKRELFPIFVFSFLHVIIGAVRSTSILCWVAADKRKIVEEWVYQMASGLNGFLHFWLLHENIATVNISCF